MVSIRPTKGQNASTKQVVVTRNTIGAGSINNDTLIRSSNNNNNNNSKQRNRRWMLRLVQFGVITSFLYLGLSQIVNENTNTILLGSSATTAATDLKPSSSSNSQISLSNRLVGWYNKIIYNIVLVSLYVRDPVGMNPFHSEQPIPIDLVDDATNKITTATNDTEIKIKKSSGFYDYYYQRMEQNRHECIRHIRNEQAQLLLPYLANNGNDPITTIIDSTSTSILLVDPAYGGNVGDHMLTLAELRFVEYYYNETVGQCTYNQGGLGYYIPNCKSMLRKQRKKFVLHQQYSITTGATKGSSNTRLIALWQAGGNWGDLYPYIQTPRIQSFETLLNTGYDTIIGLPQSLYFNDPQQEEFDALYLKQSLRRFFDHSQQSDHFSLRRSLLGENTNGTTADGGDNKNRMIQEKADEEWTQYSKKRIVLTWRDQSSYEKAVQLYPFVTNLLVPDMAFQLGPYPGQQLKPQQSRVVKSVDIVFFLSDDTESVYSQYRRNPHQIQTIINTVYHQKNNNNNNADDGQVTKELKFATYDWKSRYWVFTKDNFYFTDTAIQLLASGKVVIADRLSAAILSYLSGLPVIYLDDVYKKINRTLSVAFQAWEGCSNSEAAMYDSTTNFTTAIDRAIDFIFAYQIPS